MLIFIENTLMLDCFLCSTPATEPISSTNVPPNIPKSSALAELSDPFVEGSTTITSSSSPTTNKPKKQQPSQPLSEPVEETSPY